MQTLSGDFELTMDELRAIAGYAVACAEPALVLFQKARPDDRRPAAALHAARVFAQGAPRSVSVSVSNSFSAASPLHAEH